MSKGNISSQTLSYYLEELFKTNKKNLNGNGKKIKSMLQFSNLSFSCLCWRSINQPTLEKLPILQQINEVDHLLLHLPPLLKCLIIWSEGSKTKNFPKLFCMIWVLLLSASRKNGSSSLLGGTEKKEILARRKSFLDRLLLKLGSPLEDGHILSGRQSRHILLLILFHHLLLVGSD